ncbi:MAG: hypothetical protein EA417_09910 [Gammaproteobacteria bacterium]|nr:MAG: hypothetical protein EA417_09910 [Gammaproteobacteria bacterium]
MMAALVRCRLWLRRLIRRALTSGLLFYGRWRGKQGLGAVQRDGERLGRLHHALRPVRRRRLRKQIARIMGRTHRDPSVRQALKSAYRVNDRALLEVVALASGALTSDALAESVAVSGLEALTAEREARDGAVLLGMHMGNVFALLIELARRGVPVSVVAYQSRKLPDRFFETMLANTGIQTIQARPRIAALYELNRALKRGRTIFVAIDQIEKEGGVEALFLGKRVPIASGAAGLARKRGVSIFPVLLEAADPRWTFRIGAAIELPEQGTPEADVARLVEVVDAHIRARPELWSWHQRRWDRYPFADANGKSCPCAEERLSAASPRASSR